MNGNTIFEMYREYSREGVGVGIFCGGGWGVGILSADVRTEWDLKISLALPEVQGPSILKMSVMPGCYENLI